MSDIVTKSSIRSDEVSIINDSDPNSVFNKSPDYLKELIKTVPEEIWDMPMYEVINKGKIDIDDRKLRLAFWLEYERAVRNDTPIHMPNVYKGIVHGSRMNKTILANKYKLAFIMTPPEDYKVKLEEMLVLALDEERKILELPVVQTKIQIDKEGNEIRHEKVDSSLASLKHKIRESLQNRVHGAVAQNINQRTINKNFNVDTTSEELSKNSVEDLEKIVNELKQELKEATPVRDIGDDGE